MRIGFFTSRQSATVNHRIAAFREGRERPHPEKTPRSCTHRERSIEIMPAMAGGHRRPERSGELRGAPPAITRGARLHNSSSTSIIAMDLNPILSQTVWA